jgi:hypothetical protein
MDSASRTSPLRAPPTPAGTGTSRRTRAQAPPAPVRSPPGSGSPRSALRWPPAGAGRRRASGQGHAGTARPTVPVHPSGRSRPRGCATRARTPVPARRPPPRPRPRPRDGPRSIERPHGAAAPRPSPPPLRDGRTRAWRQRTSLASRAARRPSPGGRPRAPAPGRGWNGERGHR